MSKNEAKAEAMRYVSNAKEMVKGEGLLICNFLNTTYAPLTNNPFPRHKTNNGAATDVVKSFSEFNFFFGAVEDVEQGKIAFDLFFAE